MENPIYALSQLAQTTMRSEIGKISLDKTFEERDHLNGRIVETINDAARAWGLEAGTRTRPFDPRSESALPPGLGLRV